MDVGLNNKNTLGEIRPEFSDVVFFVEATSTEQFTLWQEWSTQSMSNIKPLSDSDVEKIQEGPLKIKIQDLNRKVKENNRNRVNWKQIMSGFGLTIGHVQKKPVVVSFSFAIINEKKICFYDCISRMADHTMIEDWLMSHFQLTHDGYTRRNHVNAANFHNCVNSLDKLDKEPRNTIYKK